MTKHFGKTTKRVRAVESVIQFQKRNQIDSITLDGHDDLADIYIDKNNDVVLILNSDFRKENQIDVKPSNLVSIKHGENNTDEKTIIEVFHDKQKEQVLEIVDKLGLLDIEHGENGTNEKTKIIFSEEKFNEIMARKENTIDVKPSSLGKITHGGNGTNEHSVIELFNDVTKEQVLELVDKTGLLSIIRGKNGTSETTKITLDDEKFNELLENKEQVLELVDKLGLLNLVHGENGTDEATKISLDDVKFKELVESIINEVNKPCECGDTINEIKDVLTTKEWNKIIADYSNKLVTDLTTNKSRFNNISFRGEDYPSIIDTTLPVVNGEFESSQLYIDHINKLDGNKLSTSGSYSRLTHRFAIDVFKKIKDETGVDLNGLSKEEINDFITNNVKNTLVNWFGCMSGLNNGNNKSFLRVRNIDKDEWSDEVYHQNNGVITQLTIPISEEYVDKDGYVHIMVYMEESVLNYNRYFYTDYVNVEFELLVEKYGKLCDCDKKEVLLFEGNKNVLWDEIELNDDISNYKELIVLYKDDNNLAHTERFPFLDDMYFFNKVSTDLFSPKFDGGVQYGINYKKIALQYGDERTLVIVRNQVLTTKSIDDTTKNIVMLIDNDSPIFTVMKIMGVKKVV